MKYETLKAGKVALTRTPLGTIKFLDVQGIERRLDDPNAIRLFEAIRDGSGIPVETHQEDGKERATNLVDNSFSHHFRPL